jgi:hypothetical protein
LTEEGRKTGRKGKGHDNPKIRKEEQEGSALGLCLSLFFQKKKKEDHTIAAFVSTTIPHATNTAVMTTSFSYLVLFSPLLTVKALSV